jgi:hypothetical protein
MSKYGWIITKDFISEGGKPGTNSNAVGVMGPKGCKFSKDEICNKGVKFEMYDDDGILYYEGYLLHGSGFEPLDDFGTPNAGAVDIKYDGKSL